MLLVRAGVQKLTLLDFDNITLSNLNRQFYFADQLGAPKVATLAENLLRINPNLDLTIHQTRLTEENCDELLAGCEIVVEAFDTPESKATLAQHYLFDATTPFVCVSGIAGYGNSDRIKVRAVGKNSWIIGDGTTGVDKAPPLAPAVLVAAAKEADKVLELILDGCV